MGQHLSKTTSEHKNDPLYLEAFAPEPSEELVSIAEEVNHFPGFNGLTPLINETFDNCAAKSKNFRSSVPPSAYAYYIAVLSWVRALKIKKMNNYGLTQEEHTLVDMIYDQGNYVVPKSIGIYLSGFGNFKIPSGPETKFNTLPYTYNRQGFFEDMENNFHCAHYPNIAIYAQRIMEDLAVTANPRANRRWHVAGINQLWTNRCLGYEDAQVLNNQLTLIFRNANITANEFPRHVDLFPVNIPLMNIVQKYLNEVATLETTVLPASVSGSIGQMIIAEPKSVRERYDLPDQIGSFSFTSQSPLSCPGSTSYLGGSFLYRIDKSAQNFGFFFPFTIEAPTEEQLERLNRNNRGWSPILQNIYHYSTVPFKSYLRIKKICSIDVKSI